MQDGVDLIAKCSRSAADSNRIGGALKRLRRDVRVREAQLEGEVAPPMYTVDPAKPILPPSSG